MRAMRTLAAALCAGGLAVAAAAGGAEADEVPTGFGNVPYSAEQVIRRADGELVQKLYHMPGHLRIEAPNGVSFLDIANKTMWVRAPGKTSYMAFPFDPASVSGTAPGGTFASVEVGEDTVDGLKTTKYSFEMTSGEMSGKGFYWLTPEGIRVKQEGETRFKPGEPAVPFSITLRNIAFGPQDPELFRLPR